MFDFEKYYIENRKRIRQIQKQYYKNNRQKMINRNKQRYKDDPERAKIYQEKWKKDNPEKVKGYRECNPEKERKRNRQYRENNREKINNYEKNRRKTDLKYNLNCRIKLGIYESLQGNKAGRHWEDLIGYTLEDLIKRLKKTMPKGYTWQDFLNGKLHIDHKIPKKAFNFTKPEHPDFRRCWALKNLQLLPVEENLSKGSKLSKSFQPALKISFISQNPATFVR